MGGGSCPDFVSCRHMNVVLGMTTWIFDMDILIQPYEGCLWDDNLDF